MGHSGRGRGALRTRRLLRDWRRMARVEGDEGARDAAALGREPAESGGRGGFGAADAVRVPRDAPAARELRPAVRGLRRHLHLHVHRLGGGLRRLQARPLRHLRRAHRGRRRGRDPLRAARRRTGQLRGAEADAADAASARGWRASPSPLGPSSPSRSSRRQSSGVAEGLVPRVAGAASVPYQQQPPVPPAVAPRSSSRRAIPLSGAQLPASHGIGSLHPTVVSQRPPLAGWGVRQMKYSGSSAEGARPSVSPRWWLRTSSTSGLMSTTTFPMDRPLSI